jgi:site-specific DNA-methyltransferase (adenine-specific)
MLRDAGSLKIRLIRGDCRRVMRGRRYDLIIADPPYAVTSLGWDKAVDGWLKVAADCLKPTGSLWLFGSMRSLMTVAPDIAAAGLRYAQDLVWEKHNGSNFHADRFKRVHEHAVQFYRADAEWAGVYNDVPTTQDATARTLRRKKRPSHMGHVEVGAFASEDGGPRLMRSVIYMRSCHGEAIHPTEKPVGLLEILIRASCPPGGLVGDFFAGSGAAGEACGHAGREYLGAEIDPRYCAAAHNRLRSTLFTDSRVA